MAGRCAKSFSDVRRAFEKIESYDFLVRDGIDCPGNQSFGIGAEVTKELLRMVIDKERWHVA